MIPEHLVVAPSLLTADLANLGAAVAELQAAGADRVHWDVMDGLFVPNMTFGPDLVAATRRYGTLPFDVHLMVADPDRLLPRWVEAGGRCIVVHVEACVHLHRTLAAIGDLGAAAGVALAPGTPAVAITDVLDLVDLVLVMTVDPGFGGQRFLPSMLAKIARVRAMLDAAGSSAELQVDGGIDAATVAAVVCHGATSVVSGSALYRHPDGMATAIAELRRAARGVDDTSGRRVHPASDGHMATLGGSMAS
jgi:ribulose-phosphate 3-epimerase